MKRTIILAAVAATLTTATAQVNTTGAAGYLTRAELMTLDRNYNGVIDQTRQLSRLSPTPTIDSRAELLAALASAGLGRESSLAQLRDYVDSHLSQADRVVAQMAVAGLLFDSGRYADALRSYNEINPDGLSTREQSAYYLQKGYCDLKVGDYDEAEAEFDRLLRLPGQANTALFYKGYVAYARGDYREAESRLRQVDTSSSPGNMADFYLSQIYYVQGDYDKALSTSRRLLKNSEGIDQRFVAEANRIAGESLYKQGNESQAISYLKRYVAAEPEAMPSAHYILGLEDYRNGDYSSAVAHLGRVTGEENAMGQNAYLLIGQSYLKEGNIDGATMALSKAQKMDYDAAVSETAFYNYAVAKMQGGRAPFESSVATFESFLDRYPRSTYAPKVQEYVIAGYLTDNNYESALASINRLNNPSEATLKAKQQILYTLASRDLSAGDATQALSRFKQAKSMGALDSEVLKECDLGIGEALYRKGDYAGAASSYLAYLSGLPSTAANRSLALYDLGYARFGEKKYGDALTDFNRYLSDTGSTSKRMVADAHNRAGDCYYYTGDYAKAAARYDTAYDLAPADGDYALYQKAMMKGLARDHRSKIAGMKEMIQKFPSSGLVPSALLESADSYSEVGDTKQAISTYQQLTKNYPSTAQGRQGYLLLAISYIEQGNRDKGIETYKKVLRDYPSSEEARAATDDLKRIYSDMGQLNDFASYLNSIPGAPSIDRAEVEKLTFQSAEKEYVNKGSVKRLEAYLKDYPKGSDAATALEYLASDARGCGNNSQALVYASRIVKEYPDSRAAEDALAIKADVEYEQGKGEMALSSYRQLEKKASTASSHNTARMGILKTSADLGHHKDVVEMADLLLSSSTVGSGEKEDVIFARAYANMKLGNNDKAIKDFLQLSSHPSTLNGSKSAYYLGQLYFDQGNLKKARKVVDALVDANPPHHYWLARGFILLSDINRKEGKTFEANEYLKSLKENYPGNESDIFKMIDSRLK